MTVRASSLIPARNLLWLGFFGTVLAAWWAMYLMARGGGDWLCGPDQVRLLPFGGFWALFPMWAVMVAAMMLPTMVPTLRVYDDLPARAGATSAGWVGLILGFGAVWLAVSAVFALIQTTAIGQGWLDLTGVVTSRHMAAALLALAGIYQFSRIKTACQTACLTPMQYFVIGFRPGLTGGLRMGAGLGAFCVGCCWAVMTLAFVGGMTSLLWMGLATAFMVAEKLPQIGKYLRLPAGVALILAGLAVAAGY